jgi:2,4-dienoyl-CoA reductase (NADPH2)
MKTPYYPSLFKPLKLDGLKLRNRMTMAPLYLGYADSRGNVSPLMREHYRLMAKSGAALIVVEGSSITPGGAGSPRSLRCDHNRYVGGLERLARIIRDEKAHAGLQINHAGRFAFVEKPVAPSSVPVFNRLPHELTKREITTIRKQYAAAALRAKRAGFDLVELHGGTGYLLAQFVSPRTNTRSDLYGGSVENRIRFPLEVLKAVKDATGDFPVGYRFLAEEWMPDGLHLTESKVLAKALEESGVAYLSVMGGTYESFFLPEIIAKSRRPGYMVSLAGAVKRAVNVPVIAAGRISTPRRAETIINEKKADLIGLARMLWVDPQWPLKARKGQDRLILKCSPKCDACMQLVMQGKPAFCPRWPKEKRSEYRALYQ